MEQFVINENDSGQRVDKFISKALPNLPKSMMYRLIRKKTSSETADDVRFPTDLSAEMY